MPQAKLAGSFRDALLSAKIAPPGLWTKVGLEKRRGDGAGLPREISNVEFLFADNGPQLVDNADVQLPDALLGNAELLADVFQSHALGIVQAGPHAEDLPLARVEVLKQPVDLVGLLLGRR